MRGAALPRRVAERVAGLDLGAVVRRPVRTYSGGTQRRLDVALGLVHRPEVLFLDEPTAGLDPEARTAMWEEVGRLAADESLAVLLTTHYLDEADRLAGRLAIVDSGRVVATGTPHELKAQLKGDAVHIELRVAPDETLVRHAVGTVPGVREISLEGLRLSARADDGAAAVPGAGRGGEEGGVREHVGRYGRAGGDRPGDAQPVPRHAGTAHRHHERQRAGAGGQHDDPVGPHRGAGSAGRRPVSRWAARTGRP